MLTLTRRTFCQTIGAQLALPDSAPGAGVDTLLGDAVDSGKIPGAVALVQDDGQPPAIKTAGWRDLARRQPMTADTIFDMRSVTKAVTAVAAMTLVAEGRIALDKPVAEHLPEVEKLEARKPITLRHLLTHTAGLAHSAPALERLTETRHLPLAEVVSICVEQPMISEPGVRWSYSSAGFAIAARLVEVADGRPFDAFVHDRVFEPLGMKDSFFHPPAKARKRLASLYSWDRAQQRLKPWRRSLPEKKWTYTSGDFGLYSTARDINRLLRSMFGGATGVVPRPLAEEMLKPHIEADIADVYQGLGWLVANSDSPCKPLGIRTACFGHNGASGVAAWADPRRERTAVFLTQVFFAPWTTAASVMRSALCS